MFGLLWRFSSGTKVAQSPIQRKVYETAALTQVQHPVPVMAGGSTQWWWFKDRFYREDESLSSEDVMALAHEIEEGRERRLMNARSRMQQGASAGSATDREHLSREAKLRVWDLDRGRCRNCGSDRLLQFDHIVPLVMGGSNSERNFQLLCDRCNQLKGGGLFEPKIGAPTTSNHEPQRPQSFPPPGRVQQADVVRLKTDSYEKIKAERERLTEVLDQERDDEVVYATLIVITNLMKEELETVESWLSESSEAIANPDATKDQWDAVGELIEWAGPELEALQVESDGMVLARDELAKVLGEPSRSAGQRRSQGIFDDVKRRVVAPLIVRADQLGAEL